MKILKLISVFIGCIPLFIAIDFLISIAISGTYNSDNVVLNSTAYAFASTCIYGYRLYHKSKLQKS